MCRIWMYDTLASTAITTIVQVNLQVTELSYRDRMRTVIVDMIGEVVKRQRAQQ